MAGVEIVEAAYNSPSGKRQTFLFENVSRDTELKTASTTFPELDGAEIQDLGVGGRKFPLTCIFSGANCKQEADNFEELLLERGVGILEHPIYGERNVVPTGSLKRTDNLVSDLNESTVEVVFSETLVVTTYPDSEVEASDKIEDALSDYDEAAAKEYAELVSTDTAETRLQFESVTKKQTGALFKDTEKTIGKLAKNKKTLTQKLNNFKASTNNVVSKIKAAAGKPDKVLQFAVSLADTVIQTVRLPARLTANSIAKINGYLSIFKNTMKNVQADPFGVKAIRNQFAITNLILGSNVASVASGVALTASKQKGRTTHVSGDREAGAITSRADAMATVAAIQEQFAEYKKYLDKEIAKNNFVDSGSGYEKLLDVVTLSVQTLTEISFNLETVKIITLDRDRQIIELLCELYGKDGFERMDEFIAENKLNADEIVCLPMGREVRYYV